MSNEIKAWTVIWVGNNTVAAMCINPENIAPGTNLYTAQQFLELVERAMPGEFVPEIPIRNIRIHAAAFNSCRTQFLTTLTALVGEMEKGK